MGFNPWDMLSYVAPMTIPEHLERRRQVRGLLLLAAVAIAFAILRAGLHRAFTAGWWRLW